MPVLPILTGETNPALRIKTKAIPKITKDILRLVIDMTETTVNAKGAGIATPQVCRTERVCIAMIQKVLTPLINPEITWHSEEILIGEEGCLSLPDIWLPVPRAQSIIVKFRTPEGKERELKLSEWDARVVQHELDHLEGILITDYRKT